MSRRLSQHRHAGKSYATNAAANSGWNDMSTATQKSPKPPVTGRRAAAAVQVTKAPWKETDFEAWFLKHPFLPARGTGDERVLVVARHRPIKRMVDIVAIDRNGGLVIIEVKNERSTRAAVGQALEYLSQYQDVTLEDLEEEFATAGTGSLSQDFAAAFGSEITKVLPRRRVFVAAPDFDYHSDLCMQFLSNAFADPDLTFGLLTVTTDPGQQRLFSLRAHNPIELTRAKDLSGFVMSPRGRLYHVLEAGPRPVLWLVGREDDGRFSYTGCPSVRVRSKPHVQLKVPPVDVERPAAESTWIKNGEKEKQARLLGIVGHGLGRRAVLARFLDGTFMKFQYKDLAELKKKWKEMPVAGLPSWRELALQIEGDRKKQLRAKQPLAAVQKNKSFDRRRTKTRARWIAPRTVR
jgi:hypothetical protein